MNTNRTQLKRRKLVYLASPYSRRFRAVRHKRFLEVCRIAGNLIDHEQLVFCPIAHSHPISEYSELDPMNWDVWMDVDLTILARCTHLYVAMLDGWEKSRGVTAEIAFAKQHNISISYINTNGEVVDAKHV